MEQFERNTVDFLQGEEASIGNIDDDDIHVPNVVEFQSIIENL